MPIPRHERLLAAYDLPVNEDEYSELTRTQRRLEMEEALAEWDEANALLDLAEELEDDDLLEAVD